MSGRSSTENNRAIIYDARVGTSLLHGYANDKRAPDRPAFWNPTFVCAPRRAGLLPHPLTSRGTHCVPPCVPQGDTLSFRAILLRVSGLLTALVRKT